MIEARPRLCLNLCELPLGLDDAQTCGEYIARLWAGDEPPERIYLGSSFCPQLVFSLSEWQVAELAAWLQEWGGRLTLTLPIATEATNDSLRAHAESLVRAASGVVDEVTVNDFGSFMHWGQLAQGGGPRMNIGRLLNRDPRDPRDPEYPHVRWTPALIDADWRGWSNLDRLLQTQPVAGVEFDPTHDEIELSALPGGLTAAVHGPLCYMSTGQICEYASIERGLEEKFRPNAACSLECQRNAIAYEGASGVEFLKLGRSVYYRAPQPRVLGIESYRSVYTPLWEVLF